MNEKLRRLQEEYEAVEIPLQLDEIIAKAFPKTLPKKKRPDRFKSWMGIATAAALLFMVSVNTFPGLTRQLISMPIIGEIADFLTIREFQVADQSSGLEGSAVENIPMMAASEPMAPEAFVNGTVEKEVDRIEETKISTQSETMNSARSYQIASNPYAPVSNMPPAPITPSYETTSPVDPWQDAVVTGEALPYSDKVYRSKIPEEMLFTNPYYDLAASPKEEEANSVPLIPSVQPLSQLFIDERYIDVLNIFVSEEIYRRNQMAITGGNTPLSWSFSGIDTNQAYYLNNINLIVLCFAAGEIAPKEAGAIEFMVPNEVVADVRIPPKL